MFKFLTQQLFWSNYSQGLFNLSEQRKGTTHSDADADKILNEVANEHFKADREQALNNERILEDALDELLSSPTMK